MSLTIQWGEILWAQKFAFYTNKNRVKKCCFVWILNKFYKKNIINKDLSFVIFASDAFYSQ